MQWNRPTLLLLILFLIFPVKGEGQDQEQEDWDFTVWQNYAFIGTDYCGIPITSNYETA